jgi:hypothetical protein
VLRISWILVLALVGGCASAPPPPPHAVGTSPLAPEDVNLPENNTRHQLATALEQRGFLPADAPPGTTLNGAIREFQKSEGLNQTGFPDDATLQALGIDPSTKDRSLDTATVNQGAASGADAPH